MKVLLALLGGSAASAFITTLVLTIHNIAASDGQSDLLSAMMGFALLAFFANLLIASTIGLLWHVYARVFGLTHLLAYVLPAIALGAGLVLVFIEVIGTNEPELNEGTKFGHLLLLALGASLGGLTALFAWLIRRPDRDAANPPTSSP